MESLESEDGQKVVLFCSGDNCAEGNKLLEEMGAKAGFELVRVDCETDENKGKCAEAGFENTPARFFTNTAEAGIEPYSGDFTAGGLADFLEFRTAPITESNVVYFESPEHFDALVEKGAVLAKFHQTWCGHCKTMKKHFEKASLAFPKDGPVTLVDIDCGQHEGFCRQHDVSSFPTVKLVQPGGKIDEYKLARSYHKITAYLKALPVAGGKPEL